MDMHDATDTKSLLQLDLIERLPNIANGEWVTVYKNDKNFAIWCALLDDSAALIAANKDEWDFGMDDGRPCFIQTYHNDECITVYNPFGGEHGIRPFIRIRDFNGAFKKYVEVLEEFRLYHNLAEDKGSQCLFDFDSSGQKIEVVKITENTVSVKRKYLMKFQAATRLHFAIFIDSRRFSNGFISSFSDDELSTGQKHGLIRWKRDIVELERKDDCKSCSILFAKIILDPPGIEKSGVWPFDHDPFKEVKFIIAIDKDGNEIEHTSDPQKIGEKKYLIPVYFRREVLSKYYEHSDRYQVSDGYLKCMDLWGLRIDNDLKEYVVVFLGDLCELPYDEKLYWRSCNITPQGEISKTNLIRNFGADFIDAESVDLTFRRKYENIIRDWKNINGWPLFLDLNEDDAHLINTIRIPGGDAQNELDEQILILAKLLIDSLNEKKLSENLESLKEGSKGIEKLQLFLEKTKFDDTERVIGFLRNLQNLRSQGSAHRKGAPYKKNISKIREDGKNNVDIFTDYLKKANDVIESLHRHLTCNRFFQK